MNPEETLAWFFIIFVVVPVVVFVLATEADKHTWCLWGFHKRVDLTRQSWRSCAYCTRCERYIK